MASPTRRNSPLPKLRFGFGGTVTFQLCVLLFMGTFVLCVVYLHVHLAVSFDREGTSELRRPAPPRPLRVAPPKFPQLVQQVLLTDIVWVPSENYVTFISISTVYLRPDFRNATHHEAHAFRIDPRIPATLASPLSLEQRLRFEGGVSLERCHDVPTRHMNTNIDRILHIVKCEHTPRNVRGVRVFYKDRLLAMLSTSVLNANQSMKFRRAHRGKHGRRVSVVIKSVHDFHPNLADILRYYTRQRVDHIYLGVNPSNNPARAKIRQMIAREPFESNLVSIGGIENDTIAFLKGKIPFLQSVLYHSKSFDDLLIVHDIDEVMVTAHPTTLRITDVLKDQAQLNETCFLELKANAVPVVNNALAPSLAERMPFRCDGGIMAFEKSVAVVGNCGYLGLHRHSACREGTGPRYVPKSEASVLHFTGLWKQRSAGDRTGAPCNITSEYTLFERATQSQILD